MYLTIREYQTDPQSVTEILRKDEEGFVPLITKAEGFLEYFSIDSGNGKKTSVSLFANRSDAERFNTIAMDWVKQNLGSLLPTPPKVTVGEIRIHATGKALVS